MQQYLINPADRSITHQSTGTRWNYDSAGNLTLVWADSSDIQQIRCGAEDALRRHLNLDPAANFKWQ
jgi:hypothetical protein